MATCNIKYIPLAIILFLHNVEDSYAQEENSGTCSIVGPVVASVIITFLVTAAIIIGTYLWHKRRKRQQGNFLIIYH